MTSSGISGGDSIGNCEKKVHMNMGLVLVTEIELPESTNAKAW
jgi:hypothetical protein